MKKLIWGGVSLQLGALSIIIVSIIRGQPISDLVNNIFFIGMGTAIISSIYVSRKNINKNSIQKNSSYEKNFLLDLSY